MPCSSRGVVGSGLAYWILLVFFHLISWVSENFTGYGHQGFTVYEKGFQLEKEIHL